MTNLNIDPKLVEAVGAAYVIAAVPQQPIPPNGFSIPGMEAAIRAVFDELGLGEEFCGTWVESKNLDIRRYGRIGDTIEAALAQIPDGNLNEGVERRYISDWKAIEP